MRRLVPLLVLALGAGSSALGQPEQSKSPSVEAILKARQAAGTAPSPSPVGPPAETRVPQPVPEKRILAPTEYIHRIVFSPDGSTLLLSDRRQILRWKTDTWESLPPYQPDPVLVITDVQYSPSGKYLGVMLGAVRFVILNAKTLEYVSELPEQVDAFSFSHDDEFVATVSRIRPLIIVLRRTADCSPAGAITIPDAIQEFSPKAVSRFVFRPDDRRILATTSAGLMSLDVQQRTVESVMPMKPYFGFYASDARTPVGFGRTASGAFWFVAFDPATFAKVEAGEPDYPSTFWRDRAWKILGEKTLGHEVPNAFSLSAGPHFAIAYSGAVELWNVPGNDPSAWRPLPSRGTAHSTKVKWIALSRDGSRIASGGEDAMLVVWKVGEDRLRPNRTLPPTVPELRRKLETFEQLEASMRAKHGELSGLRKQFDGECAALTRELSEAQASSGAISFRDAERVPRIAQALQLLQKKRGYRDALWRAENALTRGLAEIRYFRQDAEADIRMLEILEPAALGALAERIGAVLSTYESSVGKQALPTEVPTLTPEQLWQEFMLRRTNP